MKLERLLLVDGTNALMRRAAALPSVDPHTIARDVLPRVLRAGRDVRATHCIVAMDSGSSVRATRYPAYKFHRTLSTRPYTDAGQAVWTEAGLHVIACEGWEADDVIATLAARTAVPVVTLSSDNDLLMLASARVSCAQYAPKEERPWLRLLRPADVLAKYGVPVEQLLDFKTLVGEPGDAVPGIPGVGKVRAKKLLEQYGTLAAVLASGKYPADQVRQAELSRWLIELKTDLPLAPVRPSQCVLPVPVPR